MSRRAKAAQAVGISMVMALIATSGAMSNTQAQRSQGRHLHIDGVASTGFNRSLSQPIWVYPHLEQFVPVFGPFVVFAGFDTAGAFDPAVGEGGGNSAPLTPATPGDALVATYFDAIGMAPLGVDPASIPADKLNVPLDNVEVLVDDFGVERVMIPCATDTSASDLVTRAGPCTEPITLDRWMAATGSADITCRSDGSSRVLMRVNNMIPNRMYSIWFVRENIAAGPTKLVTAIPFGGVPNVLVTNRHGAASFDRDLGFCPQDEPSSLGWVVALRSNGENFGGVPVPFLNAQDPTTAFEGLAGLIPGTTINVQLNFNIGGVPAPPLPAP